MLAPIGSGAILGGLKPGLGWQGLIFRAGKLSGLLNAMQLALSFFVVSLLLLVDEGGARGRITITRLIGGRQWIGQMFLELLPENGVRRLVLCKRILGKLSRPLWCGQVWTEDAHTDMTLGRRPFLLLLRIFCGVEATREEALAAHRRKDVFEVQVRVGCDGFLFTTGRLIIRFFFRWLVEDGSFGQLGPDVGLLLSLNLPIVILRLQLRRLLLSLPESLVVDSTVRDGSC